MTTALVLFALLAACSSSSPPTENAKEQQKHPPLRFSHGYWLGYFPSSIAKEKGFFAQQGVDVELIFNPDLYGMISDFNAGKVDGIPWTMDVMVRILAKEPDVRIVLYSGYTAGADVVMARKEIQTIADLKGKKIAAKTGAMGEFLIGEMLERNGLAVDDVTLVETYEADFIRDLESDAVQAGHTWEPYASQAKKGDARQLFSSKDTPALFSDFTMFRGSVLRNRPDDVRAFIRAWFQAVDYWKAHPKEGSEIIGKALKIPPEDVSLAGYELFSLAEAQKQLPAGNDPSSLAWLVTKHIDFLVQDGQLGERPDINDMFDSSFLHSVAPPR